MFLEEIQQVEEERDFYYQKLRAVEEECKKRRPMINRQGQQLPQPFKMEIMSILSNRPEDFIETVQQTKITPRTKF